MDLKEALSTEYSKQAGRAISPDTIMLIINIAMTIFKECSANRIKKMADNHPFLARMHVANRMQAEHLARKDAEAIVKTLVNTAQTSTLSQLNKWKSND